MALRGELRQAKIEELGLAARGHENVCGLDIAMNDAFLVCGIQRVGDLHTDLEDGLDCKNAPGDTFLKRFALEQLHHDERLPIVFPNFVNGTDVRMIQRRSSTRLAAEALERLRILVERFGKKFEGDAAAELQIFGGIDHTHATTAEPFKNFVMRNGLAGHQMVAAARNDRGCSRGSQRIGKGWQSTVNSRPLEKKTEEGKVKKPSPLGHDFHRFLTKSRKMATTDC
jgi:hypothetical protein